MNKDLNKNVFLDANNFEYMNILDMNIKNIYFFIKIVEYGTLSETAKKLYVSQPYLTKTVKSLEDRLGFQLFVRENHRLFLTPKGEEFYKAFSPLLFLMYENIERIKKANFSKINVAIQYSIDFVKLQNLGLISRNVDFNRYSVQYRDFTSIFNGLNSRTIDCAVILLEYLDFFSGLNYEYANIGKVRGTAIVSQENPLAKYESLSISDIKDEELVFYSDGNRNIDEAFPLVVRYCEKIGLKYPKISFAENSYTALLEVLLFNKVLIGEELYPDFPISKLAAIPLSDCCNDVIVIFNHEISEEKRKSIEELYN